MYSYTAGWQWQSPMKGGAAVDYYKRRTRAYDCIRFFNRRSDHGYTKKVTHPRLAK
ncbi:hypothetical protein J19TS1_42140 [Heyndrickxia oleronia]|nr:hypothetical protein J19TS1_42140 [Heyndrickxia oleronia]